MINRISDEELERMVESYKGHWDGQWIADMATEILQRRFTNKEIVNICESPNHRRSHTLQQMCNFLDNIKDMIPK